MRQRLLWLLLLGLGIAILVVMAERGQAGVGPLFIKIAILVFVAGTVLTLFNERFSRAIAYALLWVLIALVLAVGYSYRFALQDVTDHVLAAFIPGHAVSHGRTVEITRASTGDFDISAQINGASINMVLDTGASSVVLTLDDAKAAGLPLVLLDYKVSIDTANGLTHAAPVTLERIAIGGLVEHSIAALVVQPGQLRVSLLGMSFLNRLQSWEVHGDRLLLRGYP